MRKYLMAVTVALFARASSVGAQSKPFSVLLGDLTSRVDSVRYESLSAIRSAAAAAKVPLCSANATPDVKRRLIDALEAENARIFDPSGSFPEAETEFHAELIGCVASLHDARAAHGLAGALDTGMGATSGLLGLGTDRATPELVSILGSANARIELRMDAAELAGQIADPASRNAPSPENRTRIRAALLATLQDRSAEVRSSAIVGLRSFPDQEVRAAILRLIAADSGGPPATASITMPAAREWLRRYDALMKLSRPR